MSGTRVGAGPKMQSWEAGASKQKKIFKTKNAAEQGNQTKPTVGKRTEWTSTEKGRDMTYIQTGMTRQR